MLKIFKYLSIAIVGIVILLILIIILAPYVIDMNKYKNMAVEKLSAELGRKISVDDVSLTIFSGLGISLENFKIEDNPTFGGEFASLGSFDIKVKVIPLIFKKVEVEKIVFNTPKIIVKRDKSDNWNFDDLKNKFGDKPEGSFKSEQEQSLFAAAQTSSSLPATYVVSNFGIKNGTIEFVDGKINQTTKLQDINLAVKNIFSNKPFSIDLTATLPGGKKKNFSLDAKLEPLKSKTNQLSFSLDHIKDITLKISSFNTDQIKPYYAPYLPQVSNIGELNLDIEGNTELSPFAFESTGNISMSNLILKNSSANLSPKIKFKVDGDGSKIDIKNFDIASKSLGLVLSGQISDYKANPNMNLLINSDSIITQDIIKLLDGFDIKLPNDLTISEKMSLSDIKINGTTSDMAINGNINLTEANIDYGNIFKKTIGQIMNLDFSVDSKTGKIAFSPFKLVLQDTELKVDGDLIYEPTLSMNLDVQSNDLNFSNLMPNLLIVSNSLPKDFGLGGKTNLSVKLAGELDNLDIKGNIGLDKTDLSYGNIFNKPANVAGNFGFDINIKSNKIELRSYMIKLQNLILSGKFSITDLANKAISGDITTNRFNLSELHQIIPELKRLNTQGFVDGKINLSGSFENIGYNGSINLAGVTLNPPGVKKPLQDINAKIQLNADSAQVKDLSGKIESSNFTGWVTINNFKTPDINFKLNFSELDIPEFVKLFSSSESTPQAVTMLIDEETFDLASLIDKESSLPNFDLFSIFASDLYAQQLNPPGALKPAAPQKVKPQKTEPKKVEPVKLEPPKMEPPKAEVQKIENNKITGPNTTGALRANGTISIGKGNYDTFAFSNFASNVRYQNKNLDLDNLLFNLYGGNYKGDVHVDLNKADPEYRLRCKVADVKSNDILSSNTSLKNILFSKMFVDLDVHGAGLEWAKISKTLTGGGLLKFLDGEVTSFNLIENTAMIANLLGYPKLAKKVTKFQELKSMLDIKNGLFHTPDLNMKSGDFDLTANGNFGIDTSLDYDCKLLFTKNASNQMIIQTNFAKYLADPSGRILIPFSVKGTILKPHFTMDKNYITDIIKRKAEEKVKETIEEGVQKALDNLLKK